MNSDAIDDFFSFVLPPESRSVSHIQHLPTAAFSKGRFFCPAEGFKGKSQVFNICFLFSDFLKIVLYFCDNVE